MRLQFREAKALEWLCPWRKERKWSITAAPPQAALYSVFQTPSLLDLDSYPVGQCQYPCVAVENAKAFEKEGKVENRKRPEAQAPTLGIRSQCVVGEVVLLSQKGPGPLTFQILGLEETPSARHGWWCPLCLVSLALKAACAFEAHPGIQPLTKHFWEDTTTILPKLPMQTSIHKP